jgi:phenylpropionate dioxygenase-like ring-hydroxylating dioxygenase large terminal subunit
LIKKYSELCELCVSAVNTPLQKSNIMEHAASVITQLKDFWYIAAESRELNSRPVRRTLLGEPLVLFRKANGSPAALIDRCAHRNMALSRGRIRDDLIECPYHGWRYRDDGKCIYIPSLPQQTDLPDPARVRAFPAVQSDEYVWVYMGTDPPAGPPPRFPHCGEPRWTTFKMKTRFQASALACLENFLDCPHTVYVHRGWFRSPHINQVRATVARHADRIEVRFAAERDAQSIVSRLLFPSGKNLLHTDRFLMPSTSRVDYHFGPDRRFIITSQCTPISDDETEVYTVISFRFGRIGSLIRLLFEPLSRRIIRQDVEILRHQTAQLKRFGGAHFVSTESDIVGPDILKLWQQATSKNHMKKTEEPLERRNVVLRF